MTTSRAAMPPSTMTPTRSAAWERVYRFQLGFRAPNWPSSCENVYVRLATWPAPLSVPFTVTVKRRNR